MAPIRDVMLRFARDSAGATAIEYALIVAVIGVGLVTSLGFLHDGIWNLIMDGIVNTLTKAINQS